MWLQRLLLRSTRFQLSIFHAAYLQVLQYYTLERYSWRGLPGVGYL